MPGIYKSKIGLVTGASSGIGHALAKAMADQGYDMILFARRMDRLQELKSAIEEKSRRRVFVRSCDIRKTDEMKKAVESSIEEAGGLDILVANAGYTIPGRFDQLEVQDYRNLYETNFFGMLNTLYPALPALKKSGGTAVIMGTFLGEFGAMDRSAYVSSKFAMRGFYESVKYEFKEQGISLLLFEPGFIKSELRFMDKRGERIPIVTDETKRKTSHSLSINPDELAKKMVRHLPGKGFRKKIFTAHAKIVHFLNWLFPALLSSFMYRNREWIRRKIIK